MPTQNPLFFVLLRRLGMAFLAASLLSATSFAEEKPQPVTLGKNGRLNYLVDAQGNRVPDFSAAGFGGGGVTIPVIPGRILVSPVAGDNGPRIQAAIDVVSAMPLDAHGWRGAVVLAKGRFEIAGQLKLRASGLVLRGGGSGVDGTVLVATGTDRRTLIDIKGKGDRAVTKPVAIADQYVPVGSATLHVSQAENLRVGNTVLVQRPSPKNWIETIGMDSSPGPTPFKWRAGTVDVIWDRVVTKIAGDEITLDAPLTTALDATYGGATVGAYTWAGRLNNIGIENLRCDSAFDAANSQDEQHAWMAVSIDAVQNAWVRSLTAVHFVSSVVQIGEGGKWITVQNCSSLAPVSELGGYRRHTFHTSGQLTLFESCESEEGRNDFTTGYLTAGPNVFLDCKAKQTHGFSGSLGSWSSGILFDNLLIDGGELKLDNLETWNQGVGWSAANSMLWQCSAAVEVCRKPPGAENWAVGVWGQFLGDGYWSLPNEFARPESLYRAQLHERTGHAVDEKPTPVAFGDTDSIPKLEVAVSDLATRIAPAGPTAGKPLALVHGWLTTGDQLLTGKGVETAWWRGNLLPALAPETGPAITRFVPGRSGTGYTDDLDAVTDHMLSANQVSFRHHWGLWYERRSDDHERVRRLTSEVWPPFFEQPWLRSGTGEAWDRLSKYDVARYNPWYFSRLRTFADLGRNKGLVLINEMFFQHNILEAGAHWAWFPLRPANSVQNLGFPEPPPYAGDKRIFMADTFYDLSSAIRRETYRAYIRQCLANLADEPNVIHTTGEEFTGPLSFVQFWLDTVAEWEKETGKHPLIALSAPKDVQDAILSDPVRSPLISVIDLKYWWRTEKAVFAPKSAQNLSPRQSEREFRSGKPSANALAGMVREYRDRFPEKAIISDLEQHVGWAFAAAGGSFPDLPKTTDPRLRAAFSRLLPVALAETPAKPAWALAEPGKQYFVYLSGGGSVSVDLKGTDGALNVYRVDLGSGKLPTEPTQTKGGGIAMLDAPSGTPAAFWITR